MGRDRTASSWWHLGLAAGALAIALLAASPAAAAAERVRVAVLPIVVHSMEPQGYLQAGLADMLAARLGRNAAVAVVRVEDPAKATTDADAAREAGSAARAEYVLFGAFTRFGEGASLDVQVLPVRSGEEAARDPRSIFIQSGTIGEIIPRLDDLAEKVARYATGQAPAVAAAPGGGSESAGLAALRRRVEALEQRLEGGASPFAGFPEIAPGGEDTTRLR